MARRKPKKSDNEIKLFFNKYIFTSQTLPFIALFSVLGIFFVLTRMKGIEQDYEYNEIAKQIKVEKIQNKELKAQRAKLMSVKKLKGFAKRFDLKEPDEKHVIVIP